jgi:hypothetical protein
MAGLQKQQKLGVVICTDTVITGCRFLPMLHNECKVECKQHVASLKGVPLFYDDSLNGVAHGVLAAE